MLMQGVVCYVQKESVMWLRTDRIWVWPAGGNLLGSDLLLHHLGLGDHGAGFLVQREKIDVITLSLTHMVQ